MLPELHARSAFSFLRGASLPEAMVARAAELGYGAIAFCDHLGFQGSARAHAAAREHGIRALVGTTLETASFKFQVSSFNTPQPPPDTPLVSCLAATRDGYAALCRHLSDRALQDPPDGTRGSPKLAERRQEPIKRDAWLSWPAEARRAKEAAAPHHPGSLFLHGEAAQTPTSNLELGTWNFQRGSLLALTGDHEFLLPRLLLAGRHPQALAFAEHLVERFGREHLGIQLTRHGLRHERRLHRLLRELAEHLRLPLVACHSPVHATRADRLLADAFTCLRHHTTLDHAGALLAPNGERHLIPPETLRQRFADVPEALDHARAFGERLEFGLENLGYRFPDAHDPAGFPLSLGEQSTRLRRLAYAGAATRYPAPLPRRVKRQLEHELRLIHRLGFPGYFLIVRDIVAFAKAHGIFCQGRGSAANSVVCHTLGITNVDPVGRGLLFERFLSENRHSWPDIDIDFPSGERRELVIQHVFEKYGPRGAAMTANVITYRPRSAFREMSKVLGFPPAVADRFSDLCSAPKVHDARETPVAGAPRSSPSPERPAPAPSHNPQSPGPGMDDYYPRSKVLDLEHTIERSGIPASHPRFGALVRLYHAALGMPRHLGQHSGGMIIRDLGLDSIVPLQPATMPGRTIVQWDKDDCEDLGIVKVDLLGLGMLAAVEEALHLCRRRGHPIDPAAVPTDDPAVYDLLCRADTIGTFQVESRAQMATLPVMKPREFYDLAIEVAIIRPGPIVGDLVHPYLNRRNGREEPDCIHPDLEPILARTLGVPLFQEQVLRMAMTLAGFDGSEADELRRAMAFKRSDEKMERIALKLRQRMTERGIPEEAQRKVIQSIGSFALYGFPESHAISFAFIAYLSCWLKVHHPAEFYCGLINHQPMGFYSVHTLLEDAKRRGIRARPVSVVDSDEMTTVLDARHLRLGLHRLKGLRQHTIRRLLEERARRPFDSLPDFLRRVRPGTRERRLLAAAGALNPLPEIEHRRHAQWQAELPLHDDLLAEVPTSKSEVPSSPLAPMSAAERLATDFALTDATTGPHPMALWRTEAKPSASPLRASDLHHLRHGTPVQVAGMVICRQRPGTAKGHCFISLEDETGIANLFVPRDSFHQHRLLITTEPFLLAHGRLQISEGEQPTVYVTSLAPLPHSHTLEAAPSHDFH